jgi:hypothetical protein
MIKIGGMCDVAIAYFKELSQHSLKGAAKNYKNFR